MTVGQIFTKLTILLKKDRYSWS